ncbi:hypothetical protein OROGR_001633 [Orobanche gracilis]
MEKAYDCVSWNFLEETLVLFGFSPTTIRLIMFCVTSASTRILWNGEPIEPIAHSRGLRQGCPLSPYLFVLCIERLSYLIQESVTRKDWTPIQICKSGPLISHVFFADDLLLMGIATKKNANANVMKKILNVFCGASGLKLSLPKSKVYFSNPGSHGLKREVCHILGFGQTSYLGRYLGVNLTHGRLKAEDFRDLIDRVVARLAGWKSKLLSLAGRNTLIQSVTAAMPSHIMSNSPLPKSICNHLDKLNRQFLHY